MATAQKKRPFQKRPFKKKHKQQVATFDDGLVRLDYGALPADLDEEGLEELVASLPKLTRKTKPKKVELTDLQALELAEMLEVAKKEKVEKPGRLRHEVIGAILDKRLSKHVPTAQALGGTVLLLIWLFVMANVIVFGAEINWRRARG